MRAVVLPGSGSDEVFVRSAFTVPLRMMDITVATPRPSDGAGVLDSYRAALDAAAARPGPFLVGGVSLGAHVATAWAAEHAAALRGRLRGVLVALPAWTGTPGAAPAALAALATAGLVRDGGVEQAVAAAVAGSPAWLGTELARAWRRHGAGLTDALTAAAHEPAPGIAALRALEVPVGIVALTDDPVHPLAVATAWRAALPRAALVTTTLAALGADPEVLGRAAVLAWLRAARSGPVRSG